MSVRFRLGVQTNSKCPIGVIGSHACLRSMFRKECRFESDIGYIKIAEIAQLVEHIIGSDEVKSPILFFSSGHLTKVPNADVKNQRKLEPQLLVAED